MKFVTGAGEIRLDDFFSFLVERTRPIVVDDKPRAIRFRLTGLLDGRRFETVTMDVGFAHATPASVDPVQGSDLLEFAGFAPIQIPVVSLAQHLAEKLHAYCAVYADGRQNTRIKDLVDIVLIVTEYGLDAAEMREQLRLTFVGRQGYLAPGRFPEPPEFWRPGYQAMAGDIGLNPDIAAGHRIASAFFDPLLSGKLSDGFIWLPESLSWNRHESPADGSSGTPG